MSDITNLISYSNEGLKFQIKGRRITSERPSRQLSVIRNYAEKDFDWLIVIIFDKDFNILNAYIMPYSVIGNYYPYRSHVNAGVVVMSEAIIRDKKVVKITEKFRA